MSNVMTIYLIKNNTDNKRNRTDIYLKQISDDIYERNIIYKTKMSMSHCWIVGGDDMCIIEVNGVDLKAFLKKYNIKFDIEISNSDLFRIEIM